MIPTAEQAKGILGPYHPMIRGLIEEAWAEWKAVQACRAAQQLPPLLYPRTLSNYIFDAIARRAILAFGAEDAVQVEIEAQTFKLHFKGLCARFKKGGEDKLGRNVPTQAALAFMDADGLLPGMPPETAKVEFVWLSNEIGDLDRVLVIARDGDQLIWEYDIDPAEPAADMLTLPISPTEPDNDGAPLVTPKTPAKPDTKQQ
ncbi:hypothetical protein E9232_006349 [Inquilinus ginsengisoli]|uniref:Uncharacterized protein n=1 Tax=Inquilinus ginsengisoli TaxID=363840 RepID=A0ABU1JYT7_9PROT|nr:hypothetical protein [Inquilinus ginsengisoli]MDR6293796.1 hypothetical protein [Inquilinus ginsengisoli]